MRVLPTVVMAVVLLSASPVLADDWVADKLHGGVFVFFQGAWVRLNRGDIVADSAVIRTGPDGAVRFTRDHETIDLAADTQIQIFDRTGQRYTVVRETQGAVSVEANVENVKHFEVRTPYIAAVVKGTIFTVMTAGKGSLVETSRGTVGVTSAQTGRRADVPAGHMAAASVAHGMAAIARPAPDAFAAGKDIKWPSAMAEVLSALPAAQVTALQTGAALESALGWTSASSDADAQQSEATTHELPAPAGNQRSGSGFGNGYGAGNGTGSVTSGGGIGNGAGNGNGNSGSGNGGGNGHGDGRGNGNHIGNGNDGRWMF